MKLLPEEPTPIMVKAWCDNCHAWDLDAYKAMYKAAPEVEQEPLSEVVNIPSMIEEINLITTDPDTDLSYGAQRALFYIKSTLEKAHGIGEQ